MLRIALCVLLLVSMVVGQASNEWITVVYEDDFGDSVMFTCNTTLPSNQPPVGAKPARWMLNDLANIPPSYNDSKYEVSSDAFSLTIKNVSKEDFGIYHCMMLINSSDSDWYLIKLGLNVRGPYYENKWEKYQTNTIVGFSAFAGVLFFGLGIMIIYTNRYIVEEEEEEEQDMEFSKPGMQGYANGHSNAAYVNEKQDLGLEDSTAL